MLYTHRILVLGVQWVCPHPKEKIDRNDNTTFVYVEVEKINKNSMLMFHVKHFLQPFDK
jgi:hypothetical protein